MKLHRDLGVTQRTAWFMLHRIREAWTQQQGGELFEGPVEVDETFIGGRAKNMHAKRSQAASDQGPRRECRQVKVVVVGIEGSGDGPRRRLGPSVPNIERVIIWPGSVIEDTVAAGRGGFHRRARRLPKVCTRAGFQHASVIAWRPAIYVSMASVHVQGVESLWSLFKRGYHGTYHHMSPKHLHRYVDEFVGRHNCRPLGTECQMGLVVEGMIGKRLTYDELTAGPPATMASADDPF